jgi:hypothetical protein
MSRDSTVGARFALWWVEALTRTAERTAALDRRAEIASDVHEQLTDARRRGVRTGSRSVIARVVRGMPSTSPGEWLSSSAPAGSRGICANRAPR